MVRTEADRSRLPGDVPVVAADFDDPASLAATLEGAGRAYLVTPSSERAAEQQCRFADLAAKAGVRHLVVPRNWPPTNTRRSGSCATTPLSSATSAGSASRTRSCGPTCTSRGCSRSPGRFPPRAGPEPVTHAQIAAALTAALGRDIAFIDVPPEAFADSLREILPPWQVQGLLEDYAHYRRGEAAFVSPAVAEITGRPPTDVRQFARDYAQAFAG